MRVLDQGGREEHAMAVTPDAARIGRAFDAQAAGYADAVQGNALLAGMRAHARAALTAAVPAGAHILELGCGPGIDAVWLGERGYRVTAIDVSAEMVAQARRRVTAAGLTHRVSIECLAVECVRVLAPAGFSAVYSSLGPLNCVDLGASVARDVIGRIEADGALVVTAMGRICPWEWLRFGLAGRWARATVRLKGRVDVPLGDYMVPTRYYTPGELAAVFEPQGMQATTVRGLGVATPPPFLKGSASRHPRWLRSLRWIDDRIGQLPVVRACGDHFLLVMRKNRPLPPLEGDA
jgi:SAM-dependent methyltransferase